MAQLQWSTILSFFKQNLILFITLLLASLFRLYALSELPSGLHNDEASFLLNAKALLTTGMDEDGRPFPLFLNSFMDPKPALYSYLQIPFVAIMQDDTLASRLPAFGFSILSLIVSYLFIKSLTSKLFALVFVGILTLSPWHIVLSRGTQEVIMSFFFMLVAVFFLCKSLSQNKFRITPIIMYFLSAILAMYSYHSAKVFLPLITVAAILLWQKPTRMYFKKSIILSLIVGLSLIGTLLLGGLDRAESISLLSDQGTQLILDEQIRTATPVLPEFFIRVFHNKAINYSLLFIKEYSNYFSPSFLFFSGGEPQRYAVPFHGLLFLIQLPLILIGLYFSFIKDKSKKIPLFFLTWFFLAPFASALTLQETPSTIRTFAMIIPLTFFTAQGWIAVWDIRNTLAKVPIRTVLTIVVLISFFYFWVLYAVHQPLYRPWHRQYAEQELVKKFKNDPPRYKNVIVSGAGDIYVYFALEGLISLSDIQNNNKEGRRGDIFTSGKYTFIRNGCYLEPQDDTLFIVKQSCGIKNEYSVVGQASYKDGAVEYKLVEYTK